MSAITDAVVIDAVRSPMGTSATGGPLRLVHPTDLLAQVLSGLVNRVGIDPTEIEAVITACSAREAKHSPAIGRRVWHGAVTSQPLPATAIEVAGSSELATRIAVQGLLAGTYQVVIAAGIQSMCSAGARPRWQGSDPRTAKQFSCNAREANSAAIAAEAMAQRCGIAREELDAFALRSFDRAAAVNRAGEFNREVTPVRLRGEGNTECGISDEIATGEYLVRDHRSGEHRSFDARGGSDLQVNQAHAAPPADCVAAVLIMSEQRARELCLTPRARFRSFALVTAAPEFACAGTTKASLVAMDRAGVMAAQLDHVEVNEALAVVPLAWQAAVGVHPEFLNPRGGAIALGDAGPAAGVRQLTTMLTALEDTGGRFGLSVNWKLGGAAAAVIIERP
ncbi:steroid 3-ketoacyl-CoA thiolase [Mycobacterium vicinigordonae]|uniref:Steroid 3-ketoacyl-CoA thiolase n=1 Tax=Mycobacterium vicinigordonae TaxID=1719132 RepID=A0A7D6E2M3_9MYCO|nr:steroid 3-ketoacyl-CoA thiolase [Mycobacterium vicinigordonae]QLL07386.1 steroid 3-ketoacyl-CoA thiolase [Mycobacterium vicinigordonae]